MDSDRQITAIDLFSGAGGTGLGLLDAGYHVLAAIDNDPNAAETYQQNIGCEVLQENIRDVDPRVFRKKLQLAKGELDLLAGCPPCQGFSRIRNSSGAGDERNGLVLDYLKFVEEFKPQNALFENVPGLIRSRHGKEHYAALLAGFHDLGYGFREYFLNAADFGVPQHRERVIVIATKGRSRTPSLIATHADPRSLEVRHGRKKPWVTVRDAIGSYPPLAAGERCPSVPNHVAPRTGFFDSRVMEFIAQVPRDGGSRDEVPRRDWLACHKRINGFKDVYGRSAWDAPSNTITGGCTNPSKGRFVHPEQDRAFSYREAAALQSFPDTFVFFGGRIGEQIGNAVPPILAQAIAEAIVDSSETREETPSLRTSQQTRFAF